MTKGIWITWENQRRNFGISQYINYPLYQFDIKANRLIRYIVSIMKTISLINREKPNIVISQNPSIILALIVISYRIFVNYEPVIDAHNSGIHPFEGQSRIWNFISKWLQKKASLTIVTNEHLAYEVESNGGKSIILPDAIPNLKISSAEIALKGRINITCICTFSSDEPYQNIIEAGKLISSDIYIYFTGKFDNKVNYAKISNNITLMGFIPDDVYCDTLAASDLIIDLTLRENCLVCGAYEGIALEKPLILSDTNINRSYFSKGCVYSKFTPKEIASAINEACHRLPELKREIKDLKIELKKHWLKQADILIDRLNNLRN